MLERDFFSAQLHSKSAKFNWSVIILSEGLTFFYDNLGNQRHDVFPGHMFPCMYSHSSLSKKADISDVNVMKIQYYRFKFSAELDLISMFKA